MTVPDRLRALGEDGLATLLVARPELVHARNISLADLARQIESRHTMNVVLCRLDAFHNAVAEVVAAFAPIVLDDLCVKLGVDEPGDAPLVAAAVDRLHDLFVLNRKQDTVERVGALKEAFQYPLGIGRPLSALASSLPASEIRRAAPAWGVKPEGRKEQIVAAIAKAMSDTSRALEMFESAPPRCMDILERGLRRGPFVDMIPGGYPPPWADWLMSRLLVVRIHPYAGPAEVPQELALALRGPAFVRVPARRPSVAPIRVPGHEGIAAHAAADVLNLVSVLLDGLDAAPAKALQSGGLGVRDLRRLGKLADLSEQDTGRLLEIAGAAELLGTLARPEEPSTGRRNQWSYTPPVCDWLPADGYDAWTASPPCERWAALAYGWLTAQVFPSRAGTRSDDGKPVPAFGGAGDAADAPRMRMAVLEALAGLPDGTAGTPTDLADVVRYAVPVSAAWRTYDPLDLQLDIISEADLLGVTAGGALSSLGRALLDSPSKAIEVAGAILPTPVSTFTLQADLTAMAAGALDGIVAAWLNQTADVESRGAATVWRFSEASLRRAFDAGADAEGLIQFLEVHATKGVPQPLAYLIRDTARRHGLLRVTAVRAVITADDPHLLAEVRASRKTAKLQLRELAPTVLSSPLEPAAVLSGLRSAGYLPVEEGADGSIMRLGADRRRGRPLNLRGSAVAVTLANAAVEAARIFAGRPFDHKWVSPPSDMFDDEPEWDPGGPEWEPEDDPAESVAEIIDLDDFREAF